MNKLHLLVLGALVLTTNDPLAFGIGFDLPALVTITRDQEALPPPAVLPGRPGADDRRAPGRKDGPPAGATAVEQPSPGTPSPPPSPVAPRRHARGTRQVVARRDPALRGPALQGPALQGPALQPAPGRGSATPASVTGEAPAEAPPAEEVVTAPLRPAAGADGAARALSPRRQFVPEPITPLVPSTILRAWDGDRARLR